MSLDDGLGPPATTERNGMALASLIVGAVSLVLCMFILPAAVGLALGLAALMQVRRSGTGRGMALGGVVTSAISLVLGVVLIIAAAVSGDNRPSGETSASPTGTASASPAGTASATPSARPGPTTPDVVGQQLDTAYDTLTAAGFTIKAEDSTGQGRTIVMRSNWVVTSQTMDGRTVRLGAEKWTDKEPEPSSAPSTPTQSEPKTPRQAVPARPTPAPAPAQPAPAPAQPAPPPAQPAPAGVYYKNCDAARAAGAAPLHAGEPGYRSALDRDKDGVACE